MRGSGLLLDYWLTRACCFAGTSRALGLSNELFVLGDSVVLTVLGQVAFMPVLVLAAKLCPEVSHLQSGLRRTPLRERFLFAHMRSQHGGPREGEVGLKT